MAYGRRSFFMLGLCVALLAGGGCVSTQETDADEAQADGFAQDDFSAPALRLAPASDAIRTIQLYRGERERNLPILPLGGAATLALEFDLMEEAGRPLSVYFYHADRTWQRDLTPAEYLDGFQRDNLLDYTPSRGTDVPYVHYTYRFPNTSIDFRLSGNYVLRVTEQGDEEAVLFERAFFVTEQAGPLELSIESLVVSGQGRPSQLPTARFTPPQELQGNVFDYSTCFVRSGDVAAPVCTSRPRLAQQPLLSFDLPPSLAFAPEGADYFLDLSALRIGGQIEATDFSVRPARVVLEPDYARFAGTGLDSLLNGQPVIEAAVTDVPDPDVAAQYVTVQFSFVPPEEQPLGDGVAVTGSFGNGPHDPAATLSWRPERARYEGEALLKQGKYEYRYTSPDPRLREVLRRALPRAASHYTAFVYYSDISRGTDRLLAVRSAEARY